MNGLEYRQALNAYIKQATAERKQKYRDDDAKSLERKQYIRRTLYQYKIRK